MDEKFKKLKNVIRILYVGSSLILACVALSALVGLFADFSHMMNACVVPNDVNEEVFEMILMSLLCLFFGSSAFMGVLHDV